MNIQFECFGILQRLCSDQPITLTVPPGSTLDDALDQLAERFPEASEALERVACAVGDQILPRRSLLEGDTTVALLPPVAGG
jgi:molybdopterin converting factor small subunit